MTAVAGPPTCRQVERAAAIRLGSTAEARWLVEHVMGRATAPDQAADPAAGARVAALVDARLAGEPLQYVLGEWAFRHLELIVDPRALIPRPETEQVVEVALAELRDLDAEASAGAGAPAVAHRADRVGEGRVGEGRVVVDLGTGTGAVALSVAFETAARIWATDRDPEALDLARANLERLRADHPAAAGRVTLCAGDWFGAPPAELRGRVDVVVSNPPYVAEGEWAGLDPEVRREPRQALVAAAGSDGTPGLADVETVLRGAADWLARPGAVVVELAPDQAVPAAALAKAVGFAEVRVARDLSGRERAVVGRR